MTRGEVVIAPGTEVEVLRFVVVLVQINVVSLRLLLSSITPNISQ